MTDGSENALSVDLLVVGGGMAGMTAAAFAAEQGLQVLVVEKAPDIGGSALLSGGGFWTAADFETLRRTNPLGEEGQAHTLIDNYDEAGDFIRSLGVAITDKTPYLTTQSFPGCVRSVDIPQFMKLARLSVEAAGGFVVTRSTVSSLLTGAEGVAGGIVEGPDGAVEVRARWTLLAAGGFQNDPALRARYIGPHAQDMIVRSNFVSDGQGLRLGLSVGAATSPHMSGWYGHTIPYPVERPLAQQDFLPYAQFYLSPRAILLDENGRRFTDESLGYYLNAQAVSVLPRGRALLLFDEALRKDDIERYGVDRFDFARRRGARVACGESWEEIAAAVASWGYSRVLEAVGQFNLAMADVGPLEPPRAANRRPVETPPLHAMEVQPAITFTHGGLRIDPQARVLDCTGEPVPGLLAAGADAGGTYHRGYAGGLAMAATFGLAAARTIVADLQRFDRPPT